MPEIRHLNAAPITEALIDIRVKARHGFDATEFSALRKELAPAFPKMEEIRASHVSFQVSATEAKVPRVEDLGLQGFFFKADEGKTIAQYRIDGFTLNRLRPYTSWEELRPLAEDLWQRYRRLANPEAITRIALRYINHLALREAFLNFDDYLRAYPQVPEELPQTVTRFLYQTSIVDEVNRSIVNVTQAFQSPPRDKPEIVVILDIDAFRPIGMAPDDGHLFEHFDNLRKFKNRVFFSYLTEKTVGLFE